MTTDGTTTLWSPDAERNWLGSERGGRALFGAWWLPLVLKHEDVDLDLVVEGDLDLVIKWLAPDMRVEGRCVLLLGRAIASGTWHTPDTIGRGLVIFAAGH